MRKYSATISDGWTSMGVDIEASTTRDAITVFLNTVTDEQVGTLYDDVGRIVFVFPDSEAV